MHALQKQQKFLNNQNFAQLRCDYHRKLPCVINQGMRCKSIRKVNHSAYSFAQITITPLRRYDSTQKAAQVQQAQCIATFGAQFPL